MTPLTTVVSRRGSRMTAHSNPTYLEILMCIKRQCAKGGLTIFECEAASEANARDHALRRVAQDNNVGMVNWS